MSQAERVQKRLDLVIRPEMKNRNTTSKPFEQF